MSRSLKKGPFLDESLEEKIDKLNETGEKVVVKTWSRRSMVVPKFLGHTISVHNGKNHIPVYISEQMIGHRFGEFSPTRFFRGHSGSDKKATKR